MSDLNSNNPLEIFSSRILDAPVEMVYRAFSDPKHLKNWWGPEGFSNTIHEFDLRPGGKWTLTMHGPEQGNYENESVFEEILPLKKIRWTRISKPLFDMEIGFQEVGPQSTEFSFRMIFATKEACDKIKAFAGSKNEENFDRLERELTTMLK